MVTNYIIPPTVVNIPSDEIDNVYIVTLDDHGYEEEFVFDHPIDAAKHLAKLRRIHEAWTLDYRHENVTVWSSKADDIVITRRTLPFNAVIPF